MDAQVGRRFGRRVTPPERRLQCLQVYFTVFAAHFKLALERNKRALVRRGAHTLRARCLFHSQPVVLAGRSWINASVSDESRLRSIALSPALWLLLPCHVEYTAFSCIS